MNEQLYLTEVAGGLARHDDPETSRRAAQSISGRTERIIYHWFDSGPMTDDELCACVPYLFPPTVKSARSRLSKRGLLVASGKTRPSARGREQIVWCLA